MNEKVSQWRWRIVKAGLNISQFADRIGKCQSQVSEWLCGKKSPKPENVKLVERELKRLGV